MADDTIDIDTQPAIEALAELSNELGRAQDAAADMGIGIDESTLAMSEFERETLKARGTINATTKEMEKSVSVTSRATGAKNLDGASAGRLTADYGKLTGSVVGAIPGFEKFGSTIASITGLTGEMGGALGGLGVAVGGALLSLDLFEFALDQIYGEMKDLKTLGNELDGMPFFQEERWGHLARQAAAVAAELEITQRIIDTGREHEEDWLDRQMSLTETMRRRDQREREAAEAREAAAAAGEAAAQRRTEAIREMATELAGLDEVSRVEAEIRAELRQEEVRKQIAEEDLQRHIDTMARRDEEAEQFRAMYQEAVDLERQLREERDESEARLASIGAATADYTSQAIDLTQRMMEISRQAREGEITEREARRLKGAEFLKDFSKQMTLKGLEQVALVPASYPNVPEMAAHGVAAGLFFAAAGAAGAGGRKLSSSVGKSQADRQDGGGRAPRAEGGGGGGGGTVVFNINAPFATRAEAAVAMDEAQRAYGRQMRGSGGNRG